jgi:hypothetical protein
MVMLRILLAAWPELLLVGLLILLAWPLPVRIAGSGEWLALEAARNVSQLGHWLPTIGTEYVPGMPPLWPWLVGLLQGWCPGLDPIALGRGLSAGVSVLTTTMLYLLAGHVFQQRWLACLTVVLWLTLGSTVGMVGSCTPLALLTMFITATALIWWPFQQAASRRRQDLLPQWIVTGVWLALSHMTFGVLGDVAVLIAVGKQWPQSRSEMLALVSPLSLVAVLWSVITGLYQGWLAGAQALVLWYPISVTWMGLVCNSVITLIPWGLFLWPYTDKRHPLRQWLQGRVWALAGIGLLCCGQYPVTAFSPLTPFLAMTLTQYLGVDANHHKLLPRLRSRVDWSMSLLILLGLGLTGWVFQYLPTVAWWPSWMLPGQPVLTSFDLLSKAITLDEGFPLWKLWLLPIPIGMVLVATITCLMSWWERFERSVFWLTGGILLLVLLVRTLALPILWPQYEHAMAATIQRLQNHLQVEQWNIPEARLNPVKYYLPLSKVPLGRHTIGLATEAYYKQMLYPEAKLYQLLPEVINMPRMVLYTQTEKP